MVAKEIFRNYLQENVVVKRLLLGLLLCGAAVGVWFGYQWHVRSYNQKAHAAFERALELYTKAERGSDVQAWSEAETAFALGYKQFSGSFLAPYFLAFNAEAAHRQDDTVRARDLMEQAVKALPVKSPLYSAYAIKLALMKIDADDVAISEQGAQELQTLAQDGTNKDRDMALYYQGLRAFDEGDLATAEKIWDELTTLYGIDSTWAQLAQAKLAYSV